MARRSILSGAFGLLLAASTLGPATAQSRAETLADIRQELSVLLVEIQRLTRELSTTGSAGSTAMPASVLERVDFMEAEMRGLISKTEELQFRIEQIVADGSNRINDLQFRVCELDPECDFNELEEKPLGGRAATAPPPRPSPPSANSGGAQLAVGEQTDFDRAKAAHDSGSFRSAADLFATFAETYPGGPLTSAAHFWRGEALTQLGETAPAARAYLTAFSSNPAGDLAPKSLLQLGRSLGALGQGGEACVTLNEVRARFPTAPEAAEATAARVNLGCG